MNLCSPVHAWPLPWPAAAGDLRGAARLGHRRCYEVQKCPLHVASALGLLMRHAHIAHRPVAPGELDRGQLRLFWAFEVSMAEGFH